MRLPLRIRELSDPKMAPVGEKAERDSILNEANGEGEEHNLWANILKEVQTSSSTKLPSNKAVLVLGDNESGKTTLVAKLQGTEDPRKGAGLEYHYIGVKDEYRDDHTRLGVWILDGDPYHSGLLQFAMNEQNFDHSLVMLVGSMAQPWTIMESLNKWSTILQDHIDRLNVPPNKRQDYEDSLVRQFQEYSEPDDNLLLSASMTASVIRRSGPNPLHPPGAGGEDKVLLPLGETTLTKNLGIPVVVVITKTDAISTLEKEHDYREEHFDFIQQHIRKFCLNFGAALFYTSVKEEKNCDLLYKYLVHRIYGFPFTSSAYVVERDSVFIPSGWDNEKKINILYENMTSMKPDDVFEDVIVKPITRKPIQRDAEIVAEDEQVFLMKFQTQLSKQPAPGGKPDGSPMRPPQGVARQTTSPRGQTGQSPNAAMTASPKKGDAVKAGTASEGVLANFFNSLLSKKTAAPPGQPGAPGQRLPGEEMAAPNRERPALNRDAAAAELDRLQRNKPKMTSPATSGNTGAS